MCLFTHKMCFEKVPVYLYMLVIVQASQCMMGTRAAIPNAVYGTHSAFIYPVAECGMVPVSLWQRLAPAKISLAQFNNLCNLYTIPKIGGVSEKEMTT